MQHLDLSHCGGLTDAGLIHLKLLTALQRLNLNSCENSPMQD
nr:hypothetical protein [Candidatus Protochlamydia sp. W-9]